MKLALALLAVLPAAAAWDLVVLPDDATGTTPSCASITQLPGTGFALAAAHSPINSSSVLSRLDERSEFARVLVSNQATSLHTKYPSSHTVLFTVRGPALLACSNRSYILSPLAFDRPYSLSHHARTCSLDGRLRSSRGGFRPGGCI